MAKKIKFVEWKPKAIRECDLPAGVKYKLCNLDQKYIKCCEGECFIFEHSGRPCAWTASAASKADIVILDWPSWCGPRPDDSITLKQAVERIGDDGVVAVVVDCGGGCIETYDESDRNEFRGTIECNAAKVLGFVVAEDE
jgi:thiol-disulfide isomerase/thioredoxin